MARFSKGLGLPHLIRKKRAIGMHHTTGFSRDEIVDLCILINSAERTPASLKWPRILGLFKSVTVTLAYLRHNRTQAEIGESFDVSQSTISRAISAITPLIEEGLAGQAPTADELDLSTQYIVDGTLLPCRSWAAHPELYSGKHKTTGMNIQLACTIYGQLAWISDPVNGARHDNYCLGESGALLHSTRRTGSAIRAMLVTRWPLRCEKNQPAVSCLTGRRNSMQRSTRSAG